MSNEQKNSNSTKVSNTFIFSFLFTLTLLVGWASSDDGLYSRAKDWQPLLTGVFAILAAYLTIKQMRKSDEQANVRHDKLMKLQLQPDYRLLERMCIPDITRINNICNFQESRSENIRETFPAIPVSTLLSFIHRTKGNFRQIAAELSTEQFTDGERLLKGSTIAILAAIRHEIELMVIFCDNTTRTITSSNEARYNQELTRNIAEESWDKIELCRRLLADVVEIMQEYNREADFPFPDEMQALKLKMTTPNPDSPENDLS